MCASRAFLKVLLLLGVSMSHFSDQTAKGTLTLVANSPAVEKRAVQDPPSKYPIISFFRQSLKPSVFWTALASSAQLV